MKNNSLFKKLLMLLAIVSINSCENDDIVFSDTQFLQVANTADVAIVENGGQMVEIEVVMSLPRSEDVSVVWDIEGDASRFALSPAGGAVTIPAGETSVSVFFSAIDNDTIDGDEVVTLSLSSSSGLPVGIGGDNNPNGSSKVITIVDDNVPCNDYVVTYTTDRWGSENLWEIIDSNGAVVATDGPYVDVAGGGTETYTTAVSLDDGCYSFRAYDWWGDGMGSDAGAGFSIDCGTLNQATNDGTFPGVPGLNLALVPVNSNYGTAFRSASATSSVDPYANHVIQVDFCVNQ